MTVEGSNTSAMSTQDEGSSLSEHLHRRFVRLAEGEEDSELEEMVSETDAYVIISGKCQGHLPLLDWNQNFRKAYTLLMWLRVVKEEEGDKEEEIEDKEEEEEVDTEEIKDKEEDEQDSLPPPRIMYRFATSPDDSEATGICVTCSDWKLSDEGHHLETELTATALAANGTASQPLKTPLRLSTNTWHLVGFTHVFPYLKRPAWTVTVDGEAIGTGELSYPMLIEKRNSPTTMEHNTVLHNLVSDGFQLHVAALSLYPLSIGSGIQAVVAEAGVNMALTSRDGRVLPLLPPVANW
jgi:hypothetical protein